MKKYMIPKEMFTDKRLYPLNQKESNVVLQLFVSKITYGKTKFYEMLYGWCLITSRTEIPEEVTIGTFEKVYATNDINCEIVRLSIYQHPEIIILLINQMLEGKTFKDSAKIAGIKTNKIKFDFTYSAAIDGNVRIRPIIFNETCPSSSRNMFEKYSHYSPFGNTPSFSLNIVNLDKLKPFRTSDSSFYPDYKKMLVKILEYLSEETKMSFATTQSARFGNIEIINGPAANIYERAQAYFKNISSEELVNGCKEKVSKKIEVTILTNKVTNSKSLLINCFSRNGGQIILDEVKEINHTSGEIIVVTFDTQEPVSDMVISIWVKEDDKWQIWFKHSAVLIRNIVTNMGMVSKTGTVTSPFLEKIESSATHLKEKVNKAKEINKSSYQQTSIGGYKVDPWVNKDYDFNSLVASLTPEKSEAAFFPKGWNAQSGEHGALAFLEWFKKVCDQASNVIIQDPYFDTIGLEFLARTSNSDTSFTIITCTQTQSNDDDKPKKKSILLRLKKFFVREKNEKPSIPNRASRIMSLMNNVSEIFEPIKLKIYDYRSKTGNEKNLLHDRYIIIYQNSGAKGFHLSNSIQNATQNHPLLITPIPQDILKNIEDYSINLLDEGQRKDSYDVITIYDYSNKKKKDIEEERKNLPPDQNLFNELKLLAKNDAEIDFDGIREIFGKYINNDYEKFENFWDTFGVFLANIPSGENVLYKVNKWISKENSFLLKKYLINLAQAQNLDKFNSSREIGRGGYHILFINDFAEALEGAFRVENYFFENYGFGNYAAGYASSALVNIDMGTFEETLSFLISEINNRTKKENLSKKPILRITAILFSDLVKELFWKADDKQIRICLVSGIMPLRALAISAIATDMVAQKNEINFTKVNEFFKLLSFDEKVKAYVALLHQTRFDKGMQQEQLRLECFKKLLQLLKCKDKKIIFETIELIVSERYFELIDVHVTNNLLLPLLDTNSITIFDIQEFWRQKFEKELKKCDVITKNVGTLDLAGWSIYVAADLDAINFVNSLIKDSKSYFFTIRKPFMSGTIAWENDYNRLLMIQTVAMIALNYIKTDKDTSTELNSKLNSVVTDVEAMKTNYPYFRDYNSFHVFNKQIAEKY